MNVATCTLTMSEAPMDPEMRARRRAANHRIAFIAHYIIFAMIVALVGVTAGPFPAVITALGWGIGLACHGFFAIVAPILRRRWTEGTANDRRVIEGRHARSLEELSASIAHEIRNPITAVKSLVAQMGEDPSNAENAEYALVALQELDRVERSIAHLLRYARDEEVVIGEARMRQIVSSAIESFRDRFAQSHVTVEQSIDTDGVVQADAEKIRRVVINLLQNALDALDASPSSEPRISIAAGENLARTEVWVRVRDNGPGIPADRLARIFTPFYTSKENGTGLGLAISKKIADAHGGTLEARALPGGSRGTEMMLVLPKRGL